MQNKLDFNLALFIPLEELRAGRMAGDMIGIFTKNMLIGGDLISRNCGMNMCISMAKMFNTWVSIADKFDAKGQDRMVCSVDELKQVTEFIFAINKVLSWVSEADLIKSTKFITEN